ncbi:hypothetical protein NL50_01270 [Clostridium acetobutylicum]|nr:hypothetical protein NL50_01270 [Clostridium acetobutylicum]
MAKNFYNNFKIKAIMPKVGDVIIKDCGEIKDNFVIAKEYENYFLAISARLGFKECFTKASFFTCELKVKYELR